MTEYSEVWRFTRDRLRPACADLSHEQLLWRPNADAHCIYEYLYHIAGAEHYWAARMSGSDPRADALTELLDRSVREGFLADGPCPCMALPPDQKSVEHALSFAFDELAPIIDEPTPEQLEMTMESPLGPIVTGREGFLRVAQHAAYHTGQIWLLRMLPDFPKA